MRFSRASRAGAQCSLPTPRANFRALSTTPERVYVGLGANLGDRAGAIQDALRRVSAYAKVVNTSFMYQTPPYVPYHAVWSPIYFIVTNKI